MQVDLLKHSRVLAGVHSCYVQLCIQLFVFSPWGKRFFFLLWIKYGVIPSHFPSWKPEYHRLWQEQIYKFFKDRKLYARGTYMHIHKLMRLWLFTYFCKCPDSGTLCSQTIKLQKFHHTNGISIVAN